MAERKNFLNKNFNVNELKKIYKQIGGVKVTGLKKNQLVTKIVALEKKNFSQNGGFGLNDIVNFFGNSNSVNILNELEPETSIPNFYGGSSDTEESTQSTDDSGSESESKKRRRRRKDKNNNQEDQEKQGQDAGYNFGLSDTSGLDFSESSLLTDSSFKLDDSSFDLNSTVSSLDSMSSLDDFSDSSY